MSYPEVAPRAVTARLTRKGQVTIPIAIRHLLGVGTHDQVTFVVTNGEVRLAPATSVVARTAGALKSDLPALSPQAERAAAEEAIAEEAVRRAP
jgi:AbrB family looped-hinge helix DNA binding protein